jgi:hypothetical protein
MRFSIIMYEPGSVILSKLAAAHLMAVRKALTE